jgi:hypothetical protein
MKRIMQAVEAYKTLYVTIPAMKKRDTIMLWPKNAKRKIRQKTIRKKDDKKSDKDKKEDKRTTRKTAKRQ